ncbi:hypothetical protein AB0I98_02965 [Streptomyces sp. NPDC050211]|uniref:hypothetical protein n=1 Tax=Streptomyces sp. NPDC050211 TaxID=3154932 RepID=UPI003434EA58
MTEIEQLLTRAAARARNTHPWGWSSLPDPVDKATLPPLLAELYLRIGDGGFGEGVLPISHRGCRTYA